MIHEFRQIPRKVKAIQFTGDNKIECIEFTEKTATAFSNAGISKKISKVNQNWFLIIPTVNGNKRADVGDYIIKITDGEQTAYLPCSPEVFVKTYEPMTDFNSSKLGKPDIKLILENALSYNHCDGVVAEGGRLEDAILTAINECLDQYKETLLNLK